MKLALPKNGVMLNQHFGASEEFAIVTVEEGDIVGLKEIATSDLKYNHNGLSELLAREGVALVIAAGIGRGACKALHESGIAVIRGTFGSIRDVLQLYLDGKLKDRTPMYSHGHRSFKPLTGLRPDIYLVYKK